MLVHVYPEPQHGTRRDAGNSRVRDWLGNTLAGHVVLVELAFSLPIFLSITAINFALDILTPASLLHSALAWFLLGLLAGLLIWRTVTAPHLRRERQRAGDRSRQGPG
jgi:thiosulfate reductase cytochrome b subunit